MDNAIKVVKDKASYVTLSNDLDGIAEYLEKYLNLWDIFKKVYVKKSITKVR